MSIHHPKANHKYPLHGEGCRCPTCTREREGIALYYAEQRKAQAYSGVDPVDFLREKLGEIDAVLLSREPLSEADQIALHSLGVHW